MSNQNFAVGDKVANKDPHCASYNWHGVIISLHKDNPDEVCWVDWHERKGKDKHGKPLYKQSIVTARFENLRKI